MSVLYLFGAKTKIPYLFIFHSLLLIYFTHLKGSKKADEGEGWQTVGQKKVDPQRYFYFVLFVLLHKIQPYQQVMQWGTSTMKLSLKLQFHSVCFCSSSFYRHVSIIHVIVIYQYAKK